MLPSKAYAEWEAEARKHMAFDLYEFPLDVPLKVEAHFFCRGRLPDLSGACESLGDAGEKYLWVNDALIVSWDGSRVFHDKENPRTEVKVTWG